MQLVNKSMVQHQVQKLLQHGNIILRILSCNSNRLKRHIRVNGIEIISIVKLSHCSWSLGMRLHSHLRCKIYESNTKSLNRIAGAAIYFVISTLSYIFVFDKTTFKHPKFLKNQIRQEISQSCNSMPLMSILTTPFFLGEVLGYSKLYDLTSEGPGVWYNWLQFPFFILFTDCFVYFIHRGLHHPSVYKTLHKPHHKWIMPTPYASIAFHPVDGWMQSLPYHIFPFIFPLQKFAYLGLFFFVQVWTVFIHDGEYVANSPILNGAACHTMHHLYFNYNYGQYTTLWDRLGGSYRKPNEELFRRESKMGQKEWERQVAEMEKLVLEAEGEDDRVYDAEEKKTN